MPPSLGDHHGRAPVHHASSHVAPGPAKPLPSAGPLQADSAVRDPATGSKL